jgi:hypothetical protein
MSFLENHSYVVEQSPQGVAHSQPLKRSGHLHTANLLDGD